MTKRSAVIRAALLTTSAVLALAAPTALAQATTTTTSEVIPLQPSPYPLYDPCTGELIYFTGEIHVIFHTTTDATDFPNLHVSAETSYLDVTGVGTESGTEFRITSAGHGGFNWNSANESSSADNFHVISQGGQENFIGQTVFHVTANANGEVTATVDRIIAECK